MNKLSVLMIALVLCACASPQRDFLQDPNSYGLYVASANFDEDVNLVVQNTATGKMERLEVRHPNRSTTAYISGSLPPGRYALVSFDEVASGISFPVSSPNGFFEVQANCYNYGGAYDFETQSDGTVLYTNTTTLKDIEKLPQSLRAPAVGRDICAASMGKPSERLAAADVQGQLNL